MKREILKSFEAWKKGAKRKPLLLMGARQVGKTFILKKFGQEYYQNVLYLNFEDNPRLCKLFDSSLDPKILLQTLSIEMNDTIIAGKTLLIFDEVQECPNALNSLKYFCENAPEQHIVAAGSLLGVKLAHVKGFPVGKVQFLTLYPMSFFEFLDALHEIKLKEWLEQGLAPISHTISSEGAQDGASDLFSPGRKHCPSDKESPGEGEDDATDCQIRLRECEKWGLKTIPPNLHDKLLDYFKKYLFVGGMPEAVAVFAESQNVAKVREIQNAILHAYALDFAKHAPKEQVMRINQIWQSIPNQLAKENRKFIYSIIREGARAKDFENALQWLIEAGLILKVSHISTPKIPLSAYAEFNIFKIYLADVGLLGAMAHLEAKTIILENDLFQEFKGALVENFVAQELTYDQFSLYYWTSGGRAEIDFIVEYEGRVYPLEVKAGYTTKKKSLKVYEEKYSPDLMLRISPMNLSKAGRILNCPLYLLESVAKIIVFNCRF